MKELQVTRVFIFVGMAALTMVVGCSKKADRQPASSSTPATAAANPQPADAASQPQTDPGPVLDNSQMVGDPKAAMAEADAALRQKEYEKAARTLMAIQQANLNAQQAALARQQMIAFQRNLAMAVASGDPNAKAAADILRASRGH